jgi:hypothetical protein
MITLRWYDTTRTGDIAVRGYDYVALYNNDYTEVFRVVNIRGAEWNRISIEGGDWTDPEAIPSKEEILRADLDFLSMENEYLEMQNEQQQADIDYCLMLLEEE